MYRILCFFFQGLAIKNREIHHVIQRRPSNLKKCCCFRYPASISTYGFHIYSIWNIYLNWLSQDFRTITSIFPWQNMYIGACRPLPRLLCRWGPYNFSVPTGEDQYFVTNFAVLGVLKSGGPVVFFFVGREWREEDWRHHFFMAKTWGVF